MGTAQQLKLKLKYFKTSVLDYQNVDADQQACVTNMCLGNCNFGQMNLQYPAVSHAEKGKKSQYKKFCILIFQLLCLIS